MRLLILAALLVLTAAPAFACEMHTTSSQQSQTTASTATDKSGG